MSAPRAHPVASTDGVTVVAYDHGGNGPEVVFCHATGFHGRYWDPICRRLADRYRCITIDLRGHGDSEIPPGLEMVWRGMSDDVLAVADAFGLHDVRAVGHSMGGCSLLMAESRRPGLLHRAWLCEPIVMPEAREEYFPTTPDGDNQMVVRAQRRREVFDSRDAVVERYASRPPFSAVDPEMLRAYVDHAFRDQADGTVILKCRREVEADVFAHSQTDMFERLDRITTPVTVAGSGDGDGPALIAPVIAEQLPNGRFEYFGDLTHFAPLEDPDRVTASIVSALG